MISEVVNYFSNHKAFSYSECVKFERYGVLPLIAITKCFRIHSTSNIGNDDMSYAELLTTFKHTLYVSIQIHKSDITLMFFRHSSSFAVTSANVFLAAASFAFSFSNFVLDDFFSRSRMFSSVSAVDLSVPSLSPRTVNLPRRSSLVAANFAFSFWWRNI